jgi:amino acid adenylation domain-containing protein
MIAVAASQVSPGTIPAGSPTVPELILTQALRSPRTTAVEAADGRHSYAELAAHTRAVARHLLELGVGTGDIVAVALPRGVELVSALLGVQLSGAAYLPLDPEHPSDRIDYILRDSGARALLTSDAASSPGLHHEMRIHLSEIAVRPEHAELAMPSALSAAYVIYTSGSTGRPKGVMVGHHALSNFVRSVRELLGLPDDVVLPAITTVSFDIAALELFVPLTTGGSVVVGSRADARDPSRLAALLARTGARFLQATPTSWRLLLDAGWTPPRGFTVLCGGERLPADLAERLTGEGVVLWDMYGPTETTVWSTLTRYARGAAPRFHPIRDTSLHLLDDRLERVPPGAKGELYIGGNGLASGYLRRPGLSAQRFIADPAPGSTGARLYRTGDIARLHPDGRIEVLGRTDDQTKIRGFRVEPGEIENVLATHPGVAAAAVRADDGADGPRLVAYVRPANADDPPDDRHLQRHLARSVPDYMIPAQFVLVEALPVTPNGKLNRAALPTARRLPRAITPCVPERSAAGDRQEPTAAGTGTAIAGRDGDTEQLVAEILAAVLERDSIGRHDDFFALGGDSLRAVQAILWLNAKLETQVPISVLFEARTVYGLACLLDSGGADDPQLLPLADGQPRRLSAAQWRLWLHQQLAPGSVIHNRPVAVRIPEDVDVTAVETAVTELLTRHDTLRTRYPLDESGQPVPLTLPADRVRLTIEDGDPRAVLADELDRPFDLVRQAPVRFRAVRQGPHDCVLVLALHEIAADDRSRALIARQLRAAFAGRVVSAPALRYVDYAAWQRKLAAGPTAQRHLDFWRMTLAGLQPAELRTDRPRPSQAGGRGGTLTFSVTPAVVAKVREVAFDNAATPAIAFLSGLFGVLGRYTTGTDLTIGVPVDGRNQPELENVVGMLENFAVVRVSLDEARSFAQLLGRVREAAIAAVGHAVPPFEDVVAAVAETATRVQPGRNPLFDVSFALRPFSEPAVVRLPDAPEVGLDLRCDLSERADGGIDGRLEYPIELFDKATLTQLARDYVELLTLASSDPALPLAVLPREAIRQGEKKCITTVIPAM